MHRRCKQRDVGTGVVGYVPDGDGKSVIPRHRFLQPGRPNSRRRHQRGSTGRSFHRRARSSKAHATARGRTRKLRPTTPEVRGTEKVTAILDIASIVDDMGFERVPRQIEQDNVRFLQTFPYTGQMTASHLARNLGCDGSSSSRTGSRRTTRSARVFSPIDPQALNARFISWVSAIHMVSAWANRAGLTLAQVKVTRKSNEITAIPDLLAMLELSRCVVTIDAMGTQPDIAERIAVDPFVKTTQRGS